MSMMKLPYKAIPKAFKEAIENKDVAAFNKQLSKLGYTKAVKDSAKYYWKEKWGDE